MPVSLNLRFAAAVPADTEFDHPAGAALMRILSRALAVAGWNTDEMDNWRDCGWSVVCRRASAKLEVVVSRIQGGEWILQVNPHRILGIISGLFGSRPSATPSDVHELALSIHQTLSAAQLVGAARWRWDGVPDDRYSTPEPQPAHGAPSNSSGFPGFHG